MIVVEYLFLLLSLYVSVSAGTYVYCVLKHFEHTGFWALKMKDGYIGIVRYPKSLLEWVNQIVVRINAIGK